MAYKTGVEHYDEMIQEQKLEKREQQSTRQKKQPQPEQSTPQEETYQLPPPLHQQEKRKRGRPKK